MEKLNVCLLNDSFPPTIDGVANVIFNYADIISRKYGEVVVATPKYPNVVDDYPFDVVRYPSMRTKHSVAYRAGYPFDPVTLKRLCEKPIDIIHSHCPIASTLLARTLKEQIDAPLIFTYHTKFDIEIRKVIRGKSLQESTIKTLVNNIEACDEIWVVSKGAGENLRSMGYKGDYVIMENGVDFPQGRADPSAVDLIKGQYGFFDADTTTFLFVGRMMWYKGIKIMLDALKVAKNNACKFKMIFVGDGIEKKDIEEYSESLGLKNDCIFVGAVRDREKLRAYFTACDLFLFPSTFDTNGIVVREAAACGLASALINGSCAAEGITDGINGILTDENAESLANTIKFACDNHEKLRFMGENAMNELYLSWDDSVAHAVERYGIVLDKYKSGLIPQKNTGYDELFSIMASVCNEAQRIVGWSDFVGGKASQWY
ncbi:MAG: glycosyltransferase, partial [Clostridia bacterium]